MREKLIEQLKLDAGATDEQIVEAVENLQETNKKLKAVKFRGLDLSDEQQASILRRQQAGLSLDDAIAAEVAQAKHDEALKGDKKAKFGKAAALIATLFLSLFLPGASWAQSVIVVPMYTNTCAAFSTNTAANTVTSPQGFQIKLGGNVTVMTSVTTTNAGAPTMFLSFQGSHDYTNWTSLATHSGTFALRGVSNSVTTASITLTNVPYNYLRWFSFGNGQTAAVSVASMQAVCH